MDRLFLDANILFSAAYRPDGGIRRLWDLADAELITCVYAATEAQRNLAPAHQAELRKLLEDVTVISTSLAELQPLPIVLHVKDQPILLDAMRAKATHLLTGDFKHFRTHYGQRVGGVLIQAPGEYLRGRLKGRG